MRACSLYSLFLFNAPATTEIYTLSLHDALPISGVGPAGRPEPRRAAEQDRQYVPFAHGRLPASGHVCSSRISASRSEEHTSELQSHSDLVCRLLLEKKKTRDLTRVQHPGVTAAS